MQDFKIPNSHSVQVEHAESWLARLNAAVADMRRFDDDAAGGLAPMETDRAVEPSNGGVGDPRAWRGV